MLSTMEEWALRVHLALAGLVTVSAIGALLAV